MVGTLPDNRPWISVTVIENVDGIGPGSSEIAMGRSADDGTDHEIVKVWGSFGWGASSPSVNDIWSPSNSLGGSKSLCKTITISVGPGGGSQPASATSHSAPMMTMVDRAPTPASLFQASSFQNPAAATVIAAGQSKRPARSRGPAVDFCAV